MIATGKRDGRDALVSGKLEREVRAKLCGYLAESECTIDHCRRRMPLCDSRLGPRIERLLADLLNVAAKAEHAVRIVTMQAGAHEHARNFMRESLRGAMGREQLGAKNSQRLRSNMAHDSSGG